MPQSAPPRVAENLSAAPSGTPLPREVGGGFVAVLAFCGIAVSVMQTLVVPLVTELPQLLHTTSSNASWVVTATLLAGAVSTPVMGRLGDMFGKRRMLMVALALMVIGSLTCAVTSDLVVMVIGRAIQGGAMGAIPLGISVMRDELPPHKLGSAMALMSSSLGIGGALGLPAAAFVAQHTNWHALFYGAAGLGVISIALVLAVVPESSVRTPSRFDAIGALGLTAGLVCLLLPITKGGDWGWTSGTTLGLFGTSVVILLLWGVFELRTAEPLVDLRTTARRQVLLTNLTSIMVGFSFYAMSLILPQLLQLPEATGYGLGQSMVMAGLYFAPMGVAMMLVSPLSARINASSGPKVSLVLGLLVIGATYGAGLVMIDHIWQIVVLSTALGVGIGIAYSAMPTLIVSAVPAAETGAANGLNTLMRSIGMSTSSAVVGVILAHQTIDFGGVALPSKDGFKVSFLVACAASVGGLLIALCLPGRRRAGRVAGSGPLATSGPVADSAPSAPVVDSAPVVGSAPVVDSVPVAVAEPVGAVTGDAGVVDDLPVLTGSVIHGRVLGPGDTPLADAAITLIDTGGRQLGRTVTGRDGRYHLPAPDAASVVLIGSAAGHQPQAATLLVSDLPVVCDLRLSGGGGLTGSVRAVGGEPLAGATVTATGPEGEVTGSVTADEKGEFALPELAPGAYTLTVAAAGYRPYATQVELTAGEPVRVDAELPPAARVRGTVRDRGGLPLGDARVSLLDASGDVVGQVITGADGSFGFEALTGDHYTVVASGYAPATRQITVGGAAGTERRDVDFLLGHGDDGEE
ncbi:MFS transporter [Streptomyces rapamycinicus]|uniref:Transporter n=2 Tax=Streptomyces rapamycinicus TaxID=1226757 RepID=A0A0A0NG30_STRRN|nr:MFS transporter [Streptomyces rapamycinicus]AGP55018.1 transporter [Streptomyces rapamycinicus NRRL 5491]MBB4782546.1 MFS family permease [Streptomyces rapamycinicus]RLV81971.1 transporter [Streptomyces rapamycinicus NRRL 5491]UTO63046.1 MFS transporter [Streptomyces rapamycinicus]UTP31005.1 MFS transporter [Streptomyces rapamycinicus NRRL 5491]